MGKGISVTLGGGARAITAVQRQFEADEADFHDTLGALNSEITELEKKIIATRDNKKYLKLQKEATHLQLDVEVCEKKRKEIKSRHTRADYEILDLLATYYTTLNKYRDRLTNIKKDLDEFKGDELILKAIFSSFPELFEKIEKATKKADNLQDRVEISDDIASCIKKLNSAQNALEKKFLAKYESRNSLMIQDKLYIYIEELDDYLDRFQKLKKELVERTEQGRRESILSILDSITLDVDSVLPAPDIDKFFKKAKRHMNTTNMGDIISILTESFRVIYFLTDQIKTEQSMRGSARVTTRRSLRKAKGYRNHYSDLQNQLIS
jgi:hypothetical protein|tara:strand:- start:347 stop:1315 length:969 start_codon:yes stop_codon:yes gene_type:complete